MKSTLNKFVLAASLLLMTNAAQAHCQSFLTIENNTNDMLYVESAHESNNVERFQSIQVGPTSSAITSWHSNNGAFDSNSYWLHLTFLDKERQEVLKMSADSTDSNTSGKHICHPDNFWVMNGYLCKQYRCEISTISDGREQADFVLKLYNK